MITISITDNIYTSGSSGLLVAADGPGGVGTGDATFDNFSASVPEPSAGTLLRGLGSLFIRRHRRGTPH